ncbi:L-rhamnose mutarotase [Micromonospora krabiensis]|uniref:L-rhamnose mutarotase n=1 Tax=Micromonospora krabiensis TaxID=307121 RepID=A0A1C3MYF9_9ACTN|nr:L-rhamnose mutarotase [Micromonospora krabiensis]SBV25376.1 L-rhamnose mutarotase [Micromonospora krabiensis]
MPRIALHTRLKPGSEREYDEVHANIPADLAAALRAAGVRDWSIWRDGRDLFHLVEVEDYQRMRHELRDHPVNVAWQARMAALLDVPDDYSGTDSGLSLVWALSSDRGGADT